MSNHAEDTMEGQVGDNRRKLPRDRTGPTIKVHVGDAEWYITANAFETGELGEIFFHGFGKEGSTLEGWSQAFACMTSIAIQYGAELPMLARKFAHMKFEPNGPTNNEDIPWCSSVVDFTFRWLARRFGDEALNKELDQIANEMRRGASRI